MTRPPRFATREEYIASRADVAFWRPLVEAVLTRHGLPVGEIVAGANATFPTFIVGEVVLKLFGFVAAHEQSWAAECAMHAVLETDPGVAAPRVVASGRLFEDGDPRWPYLVTARIDGEAWRRSELADATQRAVAVDLAQQLRRVHALPLTWHGLPARVPHLPHERTPSSRQPDRSACATPPASATESRGIWPARPCHTVELPRMRDWAHVDPIEGARRSSLPAHLVAQVDDYLARLAALPVDPVVVHGDIVSAHVFIRNGRLAGIIDWGDALVADRHYELIQVYRALFGCDRELFRVFLDAYGWPIDEHFARKALGHALHRQAIGLAQHTSMDVFEPIAERFPLRAIATLDDLANRLFGPS